MNKFLLLLCLTTTSFPLLAYLGPGMSGGAIAAALGFLAAIFLGLFGILYYPIKRAWKNRQQAKQKQTTPEEQS